MRQSSVLICSVAIAMALSACGHRSTDAQAASSDSAAANATATTPESPPAAAALAPAPHEQPAMPDTVLAGSVSSPDNTATEPKPAYTAADTVHASAWVGCKPAGATATMHWIYQDAMSQKQANKKISDDSLALAFAAPMA